METDVLWLENGWTWLNENPTHPRHHDFEEEWLRRLRLYEEAYRLCSRCC